MRNINEKHRPRFILKHTDINPKDAECEKDSSSVQDRTFIGRGILSIIDGFGFVVALLCFGGMAVVVVVVCLLFACLSGAFSDTSDHPSYEASQEEKNVYYMDENRKLSDPSVINFTDTPTGVANQMSSEERLNILKPLMGGPQLVDMREPDYDMGDYRAVRNGDDVILDGTVFSVSYLDSEHKVADIQLQNEYGCFQVILLPEITSNVKLPTINPYSRQSNQQYMAVKARIDDKVAGKLSEFVKDDNGKIISSGRLPIFKSTIPTNDDDRAAFEQRAKEWARRWPEEDKGYMCRHYI